MYWVAFIKAMEQSFRIRVLAPYCHAVCNLASSFLFNLSIKTMHPMLNVAVKAARRAGTVINRASLNLERLQV
ncbi:MAG: hypothetical protein B7Y55_08170, partial [Polynucleobacter sp. 35-46-207]